MISDRWRARLRISFSFIMLLAGLVLALLCAKTTTEVGLLGQALGLAFIVSGVVSAFQELVVAPLRAQDTDEWFSKIFGRLAGPGILMVAAERKGYPGYHKWILETGRQELFFAGHSVLHRMQADFEERRLRNIEEALWQKVREGSRVRIAFLDPTWEMIPQIALWEGQAVEKMLRDLAVSLGICLRLWKRHPTEKLPGTLEVRMHSELVQYAFHSSRCSGSSAMEMLVGFYFAGRLGTKSPLFCIEDSGTQEAFEAHFVTVFDRAKSLLRYDAGGVQEFDFEHYCHCRQALAGVLEIGVLSELCAEA